MTGAPPPSHQGQVFAEGEGDAWFARNRDHLLAFDAQGDLPLRMLRLYDLSPGRVLEVGCANGARLKAIQGEFGAEVLGVDLSEAAVRDGRERHGLDLRVQGAHELDLDGPFDLVIVHFVLHWIDRSELPTVIQGLDRQVRAGGHLLIGDFCPDAPTQVRYHHLPEREVWTYKEAYAEPFLALGTYTLIGQLTGHHNEFVPRAGVPSDERIANWLLEKRR